MSLLVATECENHGVLRVGKLIVEWKRGVYGKPFGYGAEGPPAFCPRTHAFMLFQSGSSSEANCLPPW
jgi:hypothetical protein